MNSNKLSDKDQAILKAAGKKVKVVNEGRNKESRAWSVDGRVD